MSKRDEEMNQFMPVLGIWLILFMIAVGCFCSQVADAETGREGSLGACAYIFFVGFPLLAALPAITSQLFILSSPESQSPIHTIAKQNAARDAKFAKAQQVDHALRGWEDAPALKFED